MSDIERVDPALAAGNRQSVAGYAARHFGWEVGDGIATVTLNRPERKNPLTFDSYAELRDLFGRLRFADDVHAVVVAGAGGNFCSGGDVHEIIGPLVRLKAPELLMFTRMTGDLVKAMRGLPATGGGGRRRHLRRGGRHRRDGVGPATGHDAQQDRLPVQPRRPCRLRHGRVRHAAADHRPGAGERTALHWARDDRRGGRAMGILQPLVRARRVWSTKPKRWRASWLPARLSPTASPRRCCIRNGR